MTATHNIPSLSKANAARMERAAKLREVRSGDLDPVGAILAAREGMTVFEMVCAVPGIGKHNARVKLARLGLREDLTLGEPTQTQINKGYRAATRRERVLLADEIEAYMCRTGRRAA